ncbi:stage II sporulation protein R [Brevibacillus gelatini]|uniref:stage II sporulation protein R n=1 Tax=Brevibacillus gelatini TaxID=1655277 RepID=UPI003D813089
MKRMLLIAFSLFMLMMCWEGQLTSANVLDNGPIPQESIRLRIIANSDSVQDQWLKREVRDALIAQMNTWAEDIKSFEEAEQLVASQLPVLQEVVDKTIRERGFSYQAVVDYGQVPFPTKLYGSYVYPAGNYQALRVQIGEAKGQNWWCVLFPPLCFIDMANGDAVQAAEPAARTQTEQRQPVTDLEQTSAAAAWKLDQEVAEQKEWRQDRLESEDAANRDDQTAGVFRAEQAVVEQPAPAPQVQVRFYLWEKLESWFS